MAYSRQKFMSVSRTGPPARLVWPCGPQSLGIPVFPALLSTVPMWKPSLHSPPHPGSKQYNGGRDKEERKVPESCHTVLLLTPFYPEHCHVATPSCKGSVQQVFILAFCVLRKKSTTEERRADMGTTGRLCHNGSGKEHSRFFSRVGLQLCTRVLIRPFKMTVWSEGLPSH